MSNTPSATFIPIRRHAIAVKVGQLTIGGGTPIAVQSMTSTDTADISATVNQVAALARAGSEIVRLTVNSEKAAQAIPHIVEKLAQQEITVPIAGDFHYNGHKLLAKHPACADALSKLRINPGNVGRKAKHDIQFAQLIESACRFNKTIRIGVNWGSLDQDLLQKLLDSNAKQRQPQPLDAVIREVLIESALSSAQRAEELGLAHNRIVISCKLSDVQELIRVYRKLAHLCDYPLHLGLTEAGMGIKGTVASSIAIGILLNQGIGDTIRVSLTPEPGQERTQEVLIAQEILQSLGLRSFAPSITACPGCGRTDSDYFRVLTSEVNDYVRQRMPVWKKKYQGAENIKVAVMGCVVNGPGESRHANIGISLPGTSEKPVAPVYIDGEHKLTLSGDTLAQDFKNLLEKYVSENC